MARLLLSAAVTILLPAPALAGLPALSCTIEQSCELGKACTESGTEFQLDPTEGGYSGTIDGGRVFVKQISPSAAEVPSFVFSNEESVTVLLSLYPGGKFALTVHEEIDGPYVETAYGSCVEDM